MASRSPEVSVIIVSYNTRELLRGCLESLRRVGDEIATETVVIDNASGDRSAEMIREEFGEVKLLISDRNIGFAGAVNLGLEQAEGDFVFILNPDTLVPRGTIPRLAETLRSNPDIAVAGAALTTERGRKLPSVFSIPTLFREFWNFLPELKSLFLNNPLAEMVQRPAGDSSPRRVAAVSGAAFMIHRKVFKAVGGMDQEFFLYHEELDLCTRLEQAGYEIRSVPSAQIIHFDAQSSGYSANRLASEPVLSWRVLGMERLWQKHRSARQRLRWNRQARRLLLIRILLLKMTGGFRSTRTKHYIHGRIQDLQALRTELSSRAHH